MSRVFFVVCIVWAFATGVPPLPGVTRTDKKANPHELAQYRRVMVEWYCVNTTHSKSAPCVKKHVIDGIRRRPITEIEDATTEALEYVSKTSNKEQAIKEYSDMYASFCSTAEHAQRNDICTNDILKKTYAHM